MESVQSHPNKSLKKAGKKKGEIPEVNMADEHNNSLD